MLEEDLPFANEPECYRDESRLNDPLQDSLRRVLGRVEPPRGFADSVLRAAEGAATGDQCIGQPGHTPVMASTRTPPLLFARLGVGKIHPAAAVAAMLLLVLLLPTAGYLQQRRKQVEAVAAARQFTLAMRLTQAALEDAGEHVASHNHPLDPER